MNDAHQSWEFAAAKINLTLRILGRGADGYHRLSSLVGFADIGDRLRMVATPEARAGFTLRMFGREAAALRQCDPAENLVLRAARSIAAEAERLGFSIPQALGLELEKNLPVASGIGGGSADAAATLRLLNRQFGWEMQPPTLVRLALCLGADVPACLRSRSLLMEGIGEEIQPVRLPTGLSILIVNPRIGLSTAAVFSAFAQDGGDYSPPLSLPNSLSRPDCFFDYVRRGGNDLTAAACRLNPAIAESLTVLSSLPGVDYCAMSGSGASCFALFRRRDLGLEAEQQLSRSHPDWWVSFGNLCETAPAHD
ncbi:MAG: 4-(cytidine 5'-diphospho)-2-C-methyl-D-erythritol kinase [Alphaproteobacteria bacterium]|nr:4-(cytidine 5'-diphospho)-2-C-methyl-D-erythritol kinase [Alphaproteobacteria bacterium]